MNDYIDMSSGAMDVGDAAYAPREDEVAAAVELYETRLGRPMNALERAAVKKPSGTVSAKRRCTDFRWRR